jgi:hypothetical protein
MTATVTVPAVARAAAVNVSVDERPAVTLGGLNAAVTPAGSAPVDRVTVSAVPIVRAVLTVVCLAWPRVTATVEGATAIEKSLGLAANAGVLFGVPRPVGPS